MDQSVCNDGNESSVTAAMMYPLLKDEKIVKLLHVVSDLW